MIKFVSFGFKHPGLQPPTAHVTFDLRTLFRDPHVDPAMRQLTGLDRAVVANVFRQPGFDAFVDQAARLARALAKEHGDVTVAFGCVGGRHRSVVAASAAHARLQAFPGGVELLHRDVDKPVLTRPAS